VLGECDLTVGVGGGGLYGSLAKTDLELFYSKYGRTPPALLNIQKIGFESVLVPKMYGLSQNYPNPFNSETIIGFQTPEAGNVSLVIYNILGRAVRHLLDGMQSTGYYKVVWDGRDDRSNMPGSGMYLARMEAGEFSALRKVAMMK
jgi:hypothetical protein